MSHKVDVKTQFKEIEVVLDVLKSLGWTIEQNAKARAHSIDDRKNELFQYVAVNPQAGGYDVGMNLKNGEIVFSVDFYGGSVAKTLGTDLQHLKQGYSKAKIAKLLQREDLDYTVETLHTGQLRIIAKK